MKTFKLAELSLGNRHQLMLSAVAPRPIAFAGTVDENDNINLSPFSFFNVFSTNPPVVIFSPSRRGYDGSMKHTHQNILSVPEVSISMVDYDMVQQMSLASNEYPKQVNEFAKSGLTMVASQSIRPPYVAESPVAFECRVKEVIELGGGPGAGNLIICDVDLMHVREEALDDQDQLETSKLDLVGRMGGNWYVRAAETAMFEVQKPSRDLAIGFDNLPTHLRSSEFLTANELAMLAAATQMPTKDELNQKSQQIIVEILANRQEPRDRKVRSIHLHIKKLVAANQITEALNFARLYEKMSGE